MKRKEKSAVWHVGVHATLYAKEIVDLELFIFLETNSHGIKSYGWASSEDKIMISEGEEFDTENKEESLEVLERLYIKALKLADSLNKIPSAKVIKGQYYECFEFDDRYEEAEAEGEG